MIKNILKNVKIKRYKNLPPQYCKTMRNKNIYCCIYILINKLTNEIFYVGITKKYLNIILNKLRYNPFDIIQNAFDSKLYNYIRLMNINDRYGYLNIEIFSLEHLKLDSKIELLYKERYYIELLKPFCNEVIPIRSNEEKREKNKKNVKQSYIKYYKKYQEKKTEKILCKCGYTFTKNNKIQHEKFLYHKEIIQLNFELD